MSMHRECPCHRAESPTLARRGRRVAGALLPAAAPGVMLALMPKCPACVVGYVALVSGVGISMSTAAALRTTLIVLCIASLAFVAARWGRQLIRGIARNG